jgi:2-polyprenyl-6-methoxyphenol hydroxylase-like FAD-dependent oxidoreductase
MSNLVDVLVVGAGPVGLNLALALHKQGVSCRIIDSKVGPSTTSNAIAVNARTLEIWKAMGFADTAISRGLKLSQVKLFSGSKLLNHAPFDCVESEFNFLLALPQAHTESVLIAELEKYNTHVEWNSKLTALHDNTDVVNLAYTRDDKEHNITAKWVIGCDGYHSGVRELAGFERQCEDLSQHFILMDAKLSGNISLNDMSVVFHSSGVVVFIPMQDKVRVMAEISNDPKFKDIKEGSLDIFTEIINDRHPGVVIDSIDWQSKFYIHECLVSSFRRGRVFLAGDAAHSHSPAGGQGMNTGIQDSWNLAWKLAHVVKGEAKEDLLDSYDIERRGIANDVLKRSGGLTKVATTNNKFVQLLRNLGVGGILSIDLVRNKIINSLQQTDICYSNSPLINTEQVLYQNKTKYQTIGTKWHVLSKDEIPNPDLPDFVEVVNNPLYWSDQPLCLVRPDGYIAMYADSLFEISGYLIENGIHQA